LSPNRLLQHLLVLGQLGHQFLQPGVLRRQFLHPQRLVGLAVAVLLPPAGKRRFADAQPLAHLADGRPAARSLRTTCSGEWRLPIESLLPARGLRDSHSTRTIFSGAGHPAIRLFARATAAFFSASPLQSVAGHQISGYTIE